MKKFFVISLIIFLIFSTAIIKNSTKRIDDDIFTIKENIRSLKKDFENTKLEYDFLSSAERLLELQNLYFDKELSEQNIEKMGIINKNLDNIEVNQFYFINEK
jgi:cell division protein FtsL